jgi:NADPH:quinone reductase-like Zn-dependent oxidoreductase
MARELVAIAPRTPALREYTVPALGGRTVRIRTQFASPKHGTEMSGYRGEPLARWRYDPAWGCVVPIAEEEAFAVFPHGVGNMAVGVVTDIGSDVTCFRVGDRVFGHMPIREVQTVDEDWVDLLPDGLTDEAAVCLDPAVMALPIRYVPVRLGDRVAIFGMGAVGLMAVQWARLAGADLVIAVDPIAARRAVAL